MIDYEDIDTPTWLREQRAAFFQRAAERQSRLLAGVNGLSPIPIADFFIERQIWKSPNQFAREYQGTWEVHDESAVLTPKQFNAMQRRIAHDRRERFSMWHMVLPTTEHPYANVGNEPGEDKV